MSAKKGNCQQQQKKRRLPLLGDDGKKAGYFISWYFPLVFVSRKTFLF